MIRLLLLTASSFLLWANVQAQNKFTPNGVRLGVDVFNIGRAFFEPTQQIEFTSDVYWKRWHLVTDFGVYNSQEEGADNLNFTYKNNATFARIGGEVNLLYKDFRTESLFFGLKYARASFTESFDSVVEDTTFGTNAISAENRLSAGWLEMNFGLKFRVWKQFLMGYTVRYKFGASTNGDTTFEPYRIPAYGVPNKSNFGFSYYIYYQIPIKKEPEVPKE